MCLRRQIVSGLIITFILTCLSFRASTNSYSIPCSCLLFVDLNYTTKYMTFLVKTTEAMYATSPRPSSTMTMQCYEDMSLVYWGYRALSQCYVGAIGSMPYYQVGRTGYAQLWTLHPAINLWRGATAWTLFPDESMVELVGGSKNRPYKPPPQTLVILTGNSQTSLFQLVGWNGNPGSALSCLSQSNLK